MKDFIRNTNCSFLNPAFGRDSPSSTDDEISANVVGSVKLSDLNKIRPRKLYLNKPTTKYKLHKSLPVSPVNEERSFSDYVHNPSSNTRRSFSYFIDFEDEKSSTMEGFKQICSDIEKFSHDFNKKNEQIDQTFAQKTSKDASAPEEGSFSSDSLEDCSFNSAQHKNYKPPRRCVSNNEIYKYQISSPHHEIPKSESFYLNPSNKNSQDSILSDDFDAQRTKSYCNSLESVLSCESDCKSAPLEILFSPYKKSFDGNQGTSTQSLPKAATSKEVDEFGGSLPRARLKTSQTQTDFTFETPHEIVAKKTATSSDFQEKLLKFETCIAQNDSFAAQRSFKVNKRKGVAFFVEAEQKNKSKNSSPKKQTNVCKKNNQSSMYIPSLETKNKQYESRFCNVLNNKPDLNIEIYESGVKLPGKVSQKLFCH